MSVARRTTDRKRLVPAPSLNYTVGGSDSGCVAALTNHEICARRTAAAYLLHLDSCAYLRDARANSQTVTLRNATLQAAALLGLFVVAATEALSLVNQLKFLPILALWILAAVGGTWAVRYYYYPAIAERSTVLPKFLTVVAALPFLTVSLLAMGLAVFNPPNNYDSYSYHLPRQVMWLQDANVRFTPRTTCGSWKCRRLPSLLACTSWPSEFRPLAQSHPVWGSADHLLRGIPAD